MWRISSPMTLLHLRLSTLLESNAQSAEKFTISQWQSIFSNSTTSLDPEEKPVLCSAAKAARANTRRRSSGPKRKSLPVANGPSCCRSMLEESISWSLFQTANGNVQQQSPAPSLKRWTWKTRNGTTTTTIRARRWVLQKWSLTLPDPKAGTSCYDSGVLKGVYRVPLYWLTSSTTL